MRACSYCKQNRAKYKITWPKYGTLDYYVQYACEECFVSLKLGTSKDGSPRTVKKLQ